MASDAPDSEKLQPQQENSPVTTPSKKKRPDWRLRAGSVVSGLLLVGGFVLPWVQLGEVARVSGLELMISDNVLARSAVGPLQRGLMSLVPLTGVTLLVWGGRGFPGLRWALLGAGLVLLVFGLVVVLTIFVQVTSLGLWLVVAGLLVSLITGGLLKATQ